MAYGQGQGQSNNKFVGKAQAPVVKPQQAPVPSNGTQAGVKAVRENDLFVCFKNKGLGHGITLKEDLLIPAGTKIGIFADTIVSTKDGTSYDVLKVKKMPALEQA